MGFEKEKLVECRVTYALKPSKVIETPVYQYSE